MRHSHIHQTSLETSGITIRWARFYDIMLGLLTRGQEHKFRQATLTLANIQAGEKVLDVGCGTGSLAILAKQKSGREAEIYGTDAAPEMIERARQKAHIANVDVDFRTGLAEEIQFPDETFDIVMNSLMMHHLPYQLREKSLKEIYRVLKTDGRLLIVDFEPPKNGIFKAFLKVFIGDMTSIDNTTLLPLIESAGFTNVRIGRVDKQLATFITAEKVAS